MNVFLKPNDLVLPTLYTSWGPGSRNRPYFKIVDVAPSAAEEVHYYVDALAFSFSR